MSIEMVLLTAATLVLLSVIASKASALLNVPVFVLFIGIGIVVSELPVGIGSLNDPWVAQFLGVLALALILFTGGLHTDWDSVKPVALSALSLSTLGVVATAALVGLFTYLVFDFTLLEGLLLGAIVSSTDAAAVFTTLRSNSVNLKGRLGALLEMESGSNDPMAVFLTVSVISLMQNPDMAPLEMGLFLVQQMGLGAVAGLLLGRAMVWAINRARLGYEGLYPVLALALMLFTYGLTAVLGGNGFLAVYIAGLLMGQAEFIHRRSLMRFHDGLGWLAQVIMFVTLGLLVRPAELMAVAGVGLLLAAFLLLVARPISVMLALLLSDLSLRERVMVAWVGLRGAAPIILATFPLLAGVPRAGLFFNLVFFITLSSVVIQGPLIVPLARRLGLVETARQRPRSPLEFEPTSAVNSSLAEVAVPPDSQVVGQRIMDLHLPAENLIVLIERDSQFLVPAGSTTIGPNDTLLVLASAPALESLRQRVAAPQPGE